MTKKTEADLEARVHSVMLAAFPWLSQDSLEHQTNFTVKLGHTAISVNGRSRGLVKGRSDILVKVNGEPLAIIELKREGIALTSDDVAQGLSYARLTTPMTPLVIISNGIEMQIHVTYSGEEWKPVSRTEKELNQLLHSVGKLASNGLRDAIHTLMGADKEEWVSVINAVSDRLIEARTGNWSETLVPFVRGFLLPRLATVAIVNLTTAGRRAVVLYGPPLSGKSSVLKELIELTHTKGSTAALMLEPSDGGIFHSLSNILSNELNWTVSIDDARDWIRKISNDKSATLILAVDGVNPYQTSIIDDLNELSSERFGSALRLIVTVDDNALEAITRKPSGREASAFGRVCEAIPLNPLNDLEFRHAVAVLAHNRIGLTSGCESVLSLREPWILRALVPPDLGNFPTELKDAKVRLPPLMDIEALERTVSTVQLNTDITVALQSTAVAALDQYLQPRSPGEVLRNLTTFAIDRHLLEKVVGTDGINSLRQFGLIKLGTNGAGKPVWFIRAPAIIATFIAGVLAERIDDWPEPDEAAKNLIYVAASMPFGDVIAANAVIQQVSRGKGSNLIELLNSLLKHSPKSSTLSPGTKLSFNMHGHLVRVTLTDDSKMVFESNAGKLEIDVTPEDLGLINPGAWLILSHIAGVPIGAELSGGIARLDEPLLMEIGKTPHILSLPDGKMGFKEVMVHNLPGKGEFVCHNSGIVEPITWALVKYFITQEFADAEQWISEAIKENSMPLLARISIALQNVSGIIGPRGIWAKTTLEQQIRPALNNLHMNH